MCGWFCLVSTSQLVENNVSFMGKEDALFGRTGRFKPENEQRSEYIKQLEKSHRGGTQIWECSLSVCYFLPSQVKLLNRVKS